MEEVGLYEELAQQLADTKMRYEGASQRGRCTAALARHARACRRPASDAVRRARSRAPRGVRPGNGGGRATSIDRRAVASVPRRGALLAPTPGSRPGGGHVSLARGERVDAPTPRSRASPSPRRLVASSSCSSPRRTCPPHGPDRLCGAARCPNKRTCALRRRRRRSGSATRPRQGSRLDRAGARRPVAALAAEQLRGAAPGRRRARRTASLPRCGTRWRLRTASCVDCEPSSPTQSGSEPSGRRRRAGSGRPAPRRKDSSRRCGRS